ncbi:hypothetical protein QQP08_021374 [Theobroma cacao]|nr:hypothetical protein QQP08_021374 [Theobroma cacao]
MDETSWLIRSILGNAFCSLVAGNIVVYNLESISLGGCSRLIEQLPAMVEDCNMVMEIPKQLHNRINPTVPLFIHPTESEHAAFGQPNVVSEN